MLSVNSTPLVLRALAWVCALTVCAVPARAQSFSLHHGDSQLDIDFDDPMLKQTLRVDGKSISGETGYSIVRMRTPMLEQITPNELRVQWDFPRIAIGVDYRLEDGSDAEGGASLTERLWVANFYTGTNLQFVGYSHYDLSGAEGPADQALVRSGNRIEQSGRLGTLSASTNVKNSRYEIGPPARLIENLSGGTPDLTNTPLPGVPFPTAPGDVAFAYEWKTGVSLGEVKTVAVTTKRFTFNRPPDAVPEPATVALVSIAALSLAIRRRR